MGVLYHDYWRFPLRALPYRNRSGETYKKIQNLVTVDWVNTPIGRRTFHFETRIHQHRGKRLRMRGAQKRWRGI